MFRAALATTVLLASSATAEDKYKLIDAARLAIIDALDKGDGKALAPYVGASLQTDGLWFATPKCKKLAKATVKKAQLPALAACFEPLGVAASGLLILVGPGIIINAKIDVAGGKATLTKLSSFAGDPPELFAKKLEANRTAGARDIALDAAAQAELDALPGKKIAFKVCVDTKGTVTTTQTFDVDAKSPLATQIAAATKAWTFSPFTLKNGTAIPACGIAFLPPKR